MSYHRLLRCFSSAAVLLVEFLLFVACLHAQEGQTRGSFPSRVESAFGRVQSLDLSVRTVSTLQVQNESGEVDSAEVVYRVETRHCDDGKILTTESIMPGGVEEPRYVQEHRIYSDGSVLTVQARLDDSGRQVSVPGNKYGVSLLLSDASIAQTGGPLKSESSIYATSMGSGAPFGYFAWSTVADYLSGEPVGGVEGVAGEQRLTVESELGRITIVATAEHGWFPRSMTVVKAEDDLIREEPARLYLANQLKDFPDAASQPNPLQNPSVLIREMRWTAEVTEFSQSEAGIWYPQALQCTEEMVFQDGSDSVQDISMTVSEIVGEPRTDCQPSFHIPEGLKVSIAGAPHLPYRWNGATVEPGVPDLLYGVVDDQRTSWIMYLLLVNGILLVAVIAALFVIRRYGRSR